MQLRYLRLHVFQSLLRPFSARQRRKRMVAFERRLEVDEGTSILDLGGQPHIWEPVGPRLEITILNLPGAADRGAGSHHRLRYVEGDACRVADYADSSFDVVFSNSVIEHVGPPVKQEQFASEVRRLGRSYWVQTPAIWFPLECHTGMPFWWFYPKTLQDWLLKGWQKKLPAWTEYIKDTRVLTRRRMKELFPEAEIYVERFMMIPKSYSAWYSPAPDAREGRRGA